MKKLVNSQQLSEGQIHIASDHAGIELKNLIQKEWSDTNWNDLGPFDTSSVDYPDYADKVATLVNQAKGLGILICGSGQGMALRANKFPAVRAALCWTTSVAQLSREHNDANILCLGSRTLTWAEIKPIVTCFFQSSFEGGRHTNRVNKIQSPWNP